LENSVHYLQVRALARPKIVYRLYNIVTNVKNLCHGIILEAEAAGLEPAKLFMLYFISNEAPHPAGLLPYRG
jgi:hypothetical protein